MRRPPRGLLALVLGVAALVAAPGSAPGHVWLDRPGREALARDPSVRMSADMQRLKVERRLERRLRRTEEIDGALYWYPAQEDTESLDSQIHRLGEYLRQQEREAR